MSAIVLSMLSVFLFTGCEKDTAVAPNSNRQDVIDKFKRLKFQTVTTTEDSSEEQEETKDNSSDFVQPDAGPDAQFATNTGSNNMFTDPNSSTDYFAVNGQFGYGGGSFTLNGESHDILFGFCGADIFDDLDTLGKSDEVEIFVGLAGDLDLTDLESDTASFENGYFIYALSYNGGTELVNFNDPEDFENRDDFAVVMIIEFNDEFNEGKIYFSTGGNITFSGSQVLLAGVSLVDSEGNANGSLDAILECVNFNVLGIEDEMER